MGAEDGSMSHRLPSTRRSVALAAVTIVMVFGLSPVPAVTSTPRETRPTVRVGVLVDAPALVGGVDGADTTRLALLDRIVEETVTLTRREFDVHFPEDKRLYGEYSVEGIRTAYDTLIADPEVDLVLTLGPFGTGEALRRPSFPKPVLASFVVDVAIQDIPHAGDASGVPNLNYVTVPLSVRDQVARFRDLVGFDRIHFVFDAIAPEIAPQIATRFLSIGDDLGVEIVPVPLADRAAPAADLLPDDAEAVFLFPLPRFVPGETQALLDIVNGKGIPSVSYLFDDLLDEGALLSLAPVENLDRFTRRIAINIQRILLGEDAGTLPVLLEPEGRLTINMETARRIGWYPTWDLMLSADLVNEDEETFDRTWTLDEVARESIEANLDLRAREREVAAAVQDVREARSSLLPQLDATATGVVIDDDRAEASFGQQAERTLTGSLTLSQVLWSQGARGNVTVQEALQASRSEELEAEELDVVLDATRALLNVLRARTGLRIRRDNVRLTEDNLRLAERRRDLGVSGPAEVYRWTSQLATDRRDAIDAAQQLEVARAVLNRILDRPLEEHFDVVPPDLLDPTLLSGEGRLKKYVDDPWSFERFRTFMVEEGLSRAPELRQLDAAIRAREAARRVARRSYWSPDVALFGEVTETFTEEGAGSAFTLPFPGLTGPDDTDWNVGVRATFPLFSGGGRRARLLRADEELAALRLRRDATRQALDLRIRTALFDIASSNSAIDLSAEAADAARRNLDLVRDAYSQGVVTFLELLDAQNAALVADQVASNAVFDFLIDLMEVQRATVRYDFFVSPEGREAWFDRLDTYFEATDRARVAEGGDR
jgi:outer membrane protein TolC